MNEQLQDLLDSVQRTVGQVGEAAAGAAHGVGRRAATLLSVGKLNVKVMDLKGERAAALREVGEMIYATHTGDPTDSDDLLEKLQEIDGIQRRMDLLNEEIARLQGGQVCPVCGAPGQGADVFCRECGGKL